MIISYIGNLTGSTTEGLLTKIRQLDHFVQPHSTETTNATERSEILIIFLAGEQDITESLMNIVTQYMILGKQIIVVSENANVLNKRIFSFLNPIIVENNLTTALQDLIAELETVRLVNTESVKKSEFLVVNNDVYVSTTSKNASSSRYPNRLQPPRILGKSGRIHGRGGLFAFIANELIVNPAQPILLYGMGGIGKSTLAAGLGIGLVSSFEGGCLWLDGSSNSLSSICDNIGWQYQDSEMKQLTDDQKPIRARYLLGLQPTLVVLDNCNERTVIRAFAEQCAPHALIVTLRERIAVVGKSIQLYPLQAINASNLFHEFAQSTKEQIYTNDIVSYLGGHPQGLSVAGALCFEENIAAEEFLISLGKISDNNVIRSNIQEYINDGVLKTFQVSFGHLKDAEKRLFKLFGVTWQKAATPELLSLIVEQPITQVENHLRSLFQRSLLSVDTGSDVRRYRIHDLVYAFAKSLVEVENSFDQTRTALSTALIEYSIRHLSNNDTLEAEIGNLIGATQWNIEKENYEDADIICEVIASGEDSVALLRGYTQQAIHVLEQGLKSAQKLGASKRIVTYTGALGLSYQWMGNYDKSIEYLSEATVNGSLDLGGIHLDHHLWLAEAYRLKNIYASADEVLEKATNLAKVIDDRVREGLLLSARGALSFHRGDLNLALSQHSEGLRRIRTESQQHRSECDILGWIGYISHLLGKTEDAERFLKDAIKLASDRKILRSEAVWTTNLGIIYKDTRRYDDAISTITLALEKCRRINELTEEAYLEELLGSVLQLKSDPASGLVHVENAIAAGKRLGVSRVEAKAYITGALCLKDMSLVDEASKYFNRATQIAQLMGDKYLESDAHEEWGKWAYESGDYNMAREKLMIALELRKSTGDSRLDEVKRILEKIGKNDQ